MVDILYTIFQTAVVLFLMVVIAMAVTGCAAVSCLQNTNACGLN